MFRAADLLVLTKTDLLPVLDDFDADKAERHLRELASEAPVLRVSARKDQGLDGWLDWLRAERDAHERRIAKGETLLPAIQPDGGRLHALEEEPAQHGHRHTRHTAEDT